MIRYQIYKATVTPVSGSVVWNTLHLTGELISIHVKPTTASTTWHMGFADPDGLTLWESLATETGEILRGHGYEVVNEVIQITLDSASKDEAFIVKLRIKNDYQNR